MVTSAGSKLTEASVDRAVGAKARVERRGIAKATVDTIQDRVSKRAWSPAAKHYNYASWLDLKTGKMVLKTNAPASVTAPLTKDYPGVIDRQVDTIRDSFSRFRRHPSVLGRQLDQERGVPLLVRLRGPEGRPALPHHRRALLPARRQRPDERAATSRSARSSRKARCSPPTWRSSAGRATGRRSSWARRTAPRASTSAAPAIRSSASPSTAAAASHGRAVRADGPERQRPGVHRDRLQVAGDLLHRVPLPAGRLGRAVLRLQRRRRQRVHPRDGLASGATTSFAEKWSRISSNLGVSIVT